MSSSTERDILYMLHMHTDILVLVAEKMVSFFELLARGEVSKVLEIGEGVVKEVKKAGEYKLDIYGQLSKSSSTFRAYKMREAFIRVIRSSDHVLHHYGAVVFFARYLPEKIEVPEKLVENLRKLSKNNLEMAIKYRDAIKNIDNISKVYEITKEIKRLEEENDYLYREGRIILAKSEISPENKEILRGMLDSTERFSDALDTAMDDLLVLAMLKRGGGIVRVPRSHGRR